MAAAAVASAEENGRKGEPRCPADRPWNVPTVCLLGKCQSDMNRPGKENPS